jgi:hypothetical protein
MVHKVKVPPRGTGMDPLRRLPNPVVALEVMEATRHLQDLSLLLPPEQQRISVRAQHLVIPSLHLKRGVVLRLGMVDIVVDMVRWMLVR